MKTVAIIQARMGSTRLPGKSMKRIVHVPLLGHIIKRLNYLTENNEIVVATSTCKADDAIANYLSKKGISFYRGSENDVLERFYLAAKQYCADYVIRICADCPLLDPFEIDKMIKIIKETNVDYIHNKHKMGTPFGTGGEVMTFAALESAYYESTIKWHREHVTTFIKDHPERFKILELDAPSEKYDPEIRLVIDYDDDFKLINEIYKELYKKNSIIKLEDVIVFLKNNPDIRQINFKYRE